MSGEQHAASFSIPADGAASLVVCPPILICEVNRMKTKTWLTLGFAASAGLLALVVLLRRKNRQGEAEAAQRAAPHQGLYHQFASLYDVLFKATYEKAREKTVAMLHLQPGEKLLISGVGTGLDLPHIPAGVAVTGVDISQEMLRVAVKKTSPANVTLVQMDAQNLDFPAESFDVALLNLIVSVAPDGQAVFQEAWRALKPGGRLLLFDKFLPEDQSVRLPRAVLGGVIRWIGTDINRRLSDILGHMENGVIEVNEPSVFFGQYRILRIKKVGS